MRSLVGRLRRSFLPSRADELLYSVSRRDRLPDVTCAVPLSIRRDSTRVVQYTAFVDGHPVHGSTLFPRVFLPTLFGFRGDVPCIGACRTDEAFRGKRIYPYMLQYIVRDVFERAKHDEVYMLVSPSNRSSWRGIEAAGFRRLSHLRGWRLGPFLLSRGR